MEIQINENERIDDLQLNGLKIIQNIDGFCFGIDAVLLSNFADIKKESLVIDLGTGTGIIPLILSVRNKAKKIYAFEIQEEVANMAKRSVEINNLTECIEIVNDDLNNILKYIKRNSADVVVSNPPYVQKGGGITNPGSKKAISRHEITCSLEDIFRSVSDVLKPNGSFFMVHRPSRLVDIMSLSRKYNLEPKQIRFVQPKLGKKPNILLIKMVKNGGQDLKFLDPLIVYKESGDYTDEIYKIYSEEKINSFSQEG